MADFREAQKSTTAVKPSTNKHVVITGKKTVPTANKKITGKSHITIGKKK